MSTAHTPGPWHSDKRHGTVVDAFSREVAEVFYREDLTDSEAIENAELIAKAPIAPKLAEALRELLFVSGQSMIVPNAYCEGCDAASDGRKIVHKQGCIFVRAPAALAEWDAS